MRENMHRPAEFAQSVVTAFEPKWDGKITRQMAGGEIEEVPKEEQ